METAEPRLYAIGDIVAGMPQLAHAASMEGISCVAKLRQADASHRENAHPNATYCEPQVASIGLTERAAREAGYAVKTGNSRSWGTARRRSWAITRDSSKWSPTKNSARFSACTSSGVRDRNYCGIGRGAAA